MRFDHQHQHSQSLTHGGQGRFATPPRFSLWCAPCGKERILKFWLLIFSTKHPTLLYRARQQLPVHYTPTKPIQEFGELIHYKLAATETPQILRQTGTYSWENCQTTQSERCHGTKLCPDFPALSVSPARPDTSPQHADAVRAPGFSCTIGHTNTGCAGSTITGYFRKKKKRRQ